MPFLSDVSKPILPEEEKRGDWTSAVNLGSASREKMTGDIARTGKYFADEHGWKSLSEAFGAVGKLADLREKKARSEVDPEMTEAVSGVRGLVKSPGRALLGHAAQSATEMGVTIGAGALGSAFGPAGTAAGLFTAGAGSASTRMIGEMSSVINGASVSDLAQSSKSFASDLASGMSVEKAKQRLLKKTISSSDILPASTIYGLLNAVGGVEMSAVRALTKASTQTGLKAFGKQVLKTGIEETGQEAGQEAVENVVGQQSQIAMGNQKEFDPYQTAKAAGTGAIIGGALGIGMGAPFAAIETRPEFKRKPKPPAAIVDPAQAAAVAASSAVNTPATSQKPNVDTMAQTAATVAPVNAAKVKAQATSKAAAAKRNAATGIAPPPAPPAAPVPPAAGVAAAPAPAPAVAAPTEAPLPSQVTPGPGPEAVAVTPPVTPTETAVAPKVTAEEFVNNADQVDGSEGEIIPLVKPPVVSPPSAGTQKKQAKARARKIKPDIPAPQAPPPVAEAPVAEAPVAEAPVVKPPAFVSNEPAPEAKAPKAKAPPAFTEPKTILQDTTAKPTVIVKGKVQPKGAAETAEKRAVPKGELEVEERRGDNSLRAFETKMAKGETADTTGERPKTVAALVSERTRSTKGEAIKINALIRKEMKAEIEDQAKVKTKAKTERAEKKQARSPARKTADIAEEFSPHPREADTTKLPLKVRGKMFIARLKNVVRALDAENVPAGSSPFESGARGLFDQIGVKREREVTEQDIKQLNNWQKEAAVAPKATAEDIIDLEAERQAEPEAEAEKADTGDDVEETDAGDVTETETDEGDVKIDRRELGVGTVTERAQFTEEARTSEMIDAKHGKDTSREGPVRGVSHTKTEVVGGTKKKIEVKPGEEIEVTVGGRNTEVVPGVRQFTKEEIAALQAKYNATGRTAENVREQPDLLDDLRNEDAIYNNVTVTTFHRDVSKFKKTIGHRFVTDEGKVIFIRPEGEATVEGLLSDASYVQPATNYLSYWPSPVNTTGVRLQVAMMLKRISDNLVREVPDVKVYLLDPAVMAKVRGGRTGVNAFFSPNANAVYIRSDLLGTAAFQPIALHESIHAAYLKYLHDSPEAKADVDLLYNYIKDNHYSEFKGLSLTSYSMSSSIEFITEALSNPQVMTMLSRIELPVSISSKLGIEAASKTSALRAFFGMIAKALGVKHTTVFDGILTVQGKFEAHEYPNFDTVESRAKKSRDLSIRAISHPLSDVLHQRAPPPTQGPPKQGGTWWHSPVTNIRNAWLKGRSFAQLAQDADKYFGGRVSNTLRTVHDAVERRQVITRRYADAGDVVVRKMLAASRQFSAEQFEAFEKLLFDATVANVHPDVPLTDVKNEFLGKDVLTSVQAKGRHAELHAQWQALPEDLKKLWHEIDGMTRQRQNDMTLNVVKNLVEVGLDHRDDALAQRMFDGTATTADWDLFESNTILSSINNALGLKRIQGFYMPLLRDGDWVTRGTYDLSKENLMGGTIDPAFGEGVVQFVDPTPGKKGGKTKVRDNLKAFVAQSDFRALGFQRLHVDPNDHTKQVPPEQPDGVLAYRVKLQTEHMELHDNASEAEDAKRALEKQGIATKGVVKREDIFAGGKPDMLSSEFNRLADQIAKNRGEKAMSPQLRSALREISVRVLGSTRIQSRRLPRRYVKGYSQDAAHVLSTYNISSAGYLGKLETQPTIDNALQEARDYEKAHSGDASSTTIPRSQFLEEVTKRVTDLNTRAPKAVDRWVNTILSVSQMDKLMSPSYHIINALQNITVTIPVISGRHGVRATARAFAEAYALVGAHSTAYAGMRDMARAGKGTSVSLARYLGSGFKREADLPVEVTDHMAELRKRIAKAPNSGNLTKLFDELDFLISPDAGFEVGRLTGNKSAVGTAIMHGEFIGRQVGQAVETINRSTAAIAAFNLEMGRNGGDVDAAIAYSKDTLNNTHFNYSQSNAPAFLADKHPIMRIALQFKKYAQGMVYLMVKLGHAAISKESDPRVRLEAAKSLAYVFGTTAAMAGALGLPTEPFRVGVAALGLLGFIDDDWEDVERWVEDNFGTVVAHGLPNVFGVDLSTRMGLNNMLLYGQPGGDDSKSRWAWWGQLISGAPGAYAMDLVSSLGKVGETTDSVLSGNFMDAGRSMTEFMEKVIPVRMASDMVSGYRMATEGKLSKKGDVITEPSVARGILKAVGFQSRRAAEDQRASRNLYEDTNARDALRQSFFDRWEGAKSAAERRAIRAEVMTFNRSVPKAARITWKALHNSAKRRAKTLKVKGVYISKRNKDLVQGLQ